MSSTSQYNPPDLKPRRLVSLWYPWLLPFLLYVAIHPSYASSSYDPKTIIKNLEQAYADVHDYKTNLTISGFGKEEEFKTVQKLLYRFKKPDKVRIDFESPHQGMVIVYPDHDGKVAVNFGSWFPFPSLRLNRNSSLVEISPGQHIHQTDFGMLIRNITSSMTELFLGDLKLEEDGNRLVIRVLSDNAFRKGKPTRYTFSIDTSLWLPVAVDESTPAGVLRRRVVYENLRLNTGVSDSVFRLGGREGG
jgi:outer membrane lipoprotein-sorting protein